VEVCTSDSLMQKDVGIQDYFLEWTNQRNLWAMLTNTEASEITSYANVHVSPKYLICFCSQLHEGCAQLSARNRAGKLRKLKEQTNKNKTNSVALRPRANYTDWATVTCRRNLVLTFVTRQIPYGRLSRQCGILNILQPSGLPRPVMKIALLKLKWSMEYM
jgi:hypothetical protein